MVTMCKMILSYKPRISLYIPSPIKVAIAGYHGLLGDNTSFLWIYPRNPFYCHSKEGWNNYRTLRKASHVCSFSLRGPSVEHISEEPFHKTVNWLSSCDNGLTVIVIRYKMYMYFVYIVYRIFMVYGNFYNENLLYNVMLQDGDETPYIMAAYTCLYVSNWNWNLFSLLCSILDIELNFTVSSVYLDPRDPTCFQFHIIVSSRRESWQHTGIRAVTIRQIGILHIACKMFTIHCCMQYRCGYC